MSRNMHQALVNIMQPDSLHVVKLGVQNDIISTLQNHFPEIIGPWLEKLKQKRERGGMPGNLLNGKVEFKKIPTFFGKSKKEL